MNIFIIFACLAIAVSADTQEEWTQFKQAHKKSYRSLIEERLRYQIFSDNLEKINDHNEKFAKGESTFTMKVNQFADMTEEEFKGMFNTLKPLKFTKMHEKMQKTPAEKNWRSEGAVSEVKDQKRCGSCWAFSTTGSLEGQYYIKNNKSVSLSEQNLIDCASQKPYRNRGCRGGFMVSAFDYVKDHGIMTEEAYPYEDRLSECRYDKSKSVLKITGHVGIKRDDEEDLKNAVGTVGPVSVSIHVGILMQFYSSGIYDDFLCQKWLRNHAVLAVGYGRENGTDFWIVKNSLGPTWGEDGYIRMLGGKNLCGIATDASYPIL